MEKRFLHADTVKHKASTAEGAEVHGGKAGERIEGGQTGLAGAVAPQYDDAMTPAAIKPAIALDVLEKIDIRVGTILAVSDVPGSDKLIQMRVSFGDHERTILSGMKQERADPREIEGKQALFVVNLEPRKMKGIVSEGMLFDIGYADGVLPALAMPERPVPDGSRAG